MGLMAHLIAGWRINDISLFNLTVMWVGFNLDSFAMSILLCNVDRTPLLFFIAVTTSRNKYWNLLKYAVSVIRVMYVY
jgi:hypothetical protein